MKFNKLIIILLLCLAVCLSVTYTVYSFVQAVQNPQLPVLGQVHEFSLMDSQGNQFTLKDLKGTVWIADFFFTTCGDICPILSKNMASLHRSLDSVKEASLVSITVNPEFDTSEILARYSRKYKADVNKWHFLTGPREVIKEMAVSSFKLGSVEEPVFHSAKFTLVDRHGLIRGYYDGVDGEEVNRLFKDLSVLVKDK